MMKQEERDRRSAELERLLDVHGGDDRRWPAHARAAIVELSCPLPDGSRRLAEANALSRLLDMAPMPTPDRQRALADRIVAAALAAPIDSATTTTLVQPPQATKPASVVILADRRSRGTPRAALSTSGNWRTAAAVMAASLLIGILLGDPSRNDPLTQGVAATVGDVTGYASGTSTALAEETGDEDLL